MKIIEKDECRDVQTLIAMRDPSTDVHKVIIFLLARSSRYTGRWTFGTRDILLEYLYYKDDFSNAKTIWEELTRMDMNTLFSLVKDATDGTRMLDVENLGKFVWVYPKGLDEDVWDFCISLDLDDKVKRMLLSNITDGYIYANIASRASKEPYALDMYSYFLLKMAEKLEIPMERKKLKSVIEYRCKEWSASFDQACIIKLPTRTDEYELFAVGSIKAPNRVLHHACCNDYGATPTTEDVVFSFFTNVMERIVGLYTTDEKCLCDIIYTMFKSFDISLDQNPVAKPPKYIDITLSMLPKREETEYAGAVARFFSDILKAYMFVSALTLATSTVCVQLYPAVSRLDVEHSILKYLTYASLVHEVNMNTDVVVLFKKIFEKVLGVGKPDALRLSNFLF